MGEAEIYACLRKHFKHDSFRGGQLQAIKESLAGRDVVVIMPTGSGKSLCYQLPAMLLPGVTLVVSPLIALMKDQVDALERNGIAASFINSSVPPDEMTSRLASLEAGRCKLAYVAPERFRNPRFLDSLSRTKISLLTIDEAHCISQWGHDFRPDYLNLRHAAALIPGVRIMAVTATATPDVRRDIIKQLGLGTDDRAEPAIHVHGFKRDNLSISVFRCRTHAEKLARVMRLIDQQRIGIVYSSTRRQAERVYTMIRESLGVGGFASGAGMPDVILYHGAMSDDERAAAHESFIKSSSPVIVATNAFGMGVDRADIRFVAHWDVPGSIEAYYQEIGRAGRDGAPAFCELLFNYADVRTQEFFIAGANPEYSDAIRLFETIKAKTADDPKTIPVEMWAEYAGVKNPMAAHTIMGILERARLIERAVAPRQRTYATRALPNADAASLKQIFERRTEKAARDQARLDAVLKFVDYNQCRLRYILEYFGENADGLLCGICDNCATDAPPLTEEQWIVIQKVLSCVAKMRGRYGPGRIAQVLTGDADPMLEEKGLTALSTFGILPNERLGTLYAVLSELARVGCISVSDDNYRIMSITDKGKAVAKRQLRGFTMKWPTIGTPRRTGRGKRFF